jgi:hypothetical protein
MLCKYSNSRDLTRNGAASLPAAARLDASLLLLLEKNSFSAADKDRATFETFYYCQPLAP